MERIARSFQLVGQSYAVLSHDAELMVMPLLSGIMMVALVAAFAYGVGLDPEQMRAHPTAIPGPVFVLYVLLNAVGIFFQAAVVAGAAERLRGGNPTVLSALGAAARRIIPILAWAFLSATVGLALRLLAERLHLLGKVVVGSLGLAWSLATFFVVPVLVLEDVLFGESISRSTEIFSETWGETMVGGIGLGAAATCAWLTLGGLSLGAATLVGEGALIGFATGAVFLMVFFSTLQGIFLASLYRFATGGGTGDWCDTGLLREAFVRKDG